ncbi:MAG: hypothetical protein R2712_24195 [Vicinamibacterales bacterium]
MQSRVSDYKALVCKSTCSAATMRTTLIVPVDNYAAYLRRAAAPTASRWPPTRCCPSAARAAPPTACTRR